MTESHLVEEQLVALALGDLQDEQTAMLEHLRDCQACRTAYDDISGAVDAVLPAAPTVAPPAGFDARVLERLGVKPPASPAPRRSRRSRRIPVLVAAAAAAVGIGIGSAVTATVADRAPANVAVSENGARLVSRTGSTVGSVEPSRAGDERVVVMQITDAPPGKHYSCRLVLKDGTVRDAGAWWVPASGRATWIAYGTASTIDRVELVGDDGSVWSTADL
ncbi:anti-sigma factor [Streptomyces sp. NPDC005408]|uniref:anti-sigma factor domain-containing protein n=1 Tax=Streptomyces sp. NPDC005408 TaxID=3155341 RepID=UPI0033BAA5BE